MILKFISAHIGYQDQAFKINNNHRAYFQIWLKVGGDLTFKEGIIVLTYPKAQSPHLPPPLVDTLDKKIFFRN